jgi:hypothetical protein
MHMSTRRGLTGLAGVALVALAAVTVASATIPDGGGVIHGCYRTKSGNLRVIDSSTSSCRDSETALNWNQAGPQGTQGPPGPQGEPGPPGDGTSFSATVTMGQPSLTDLLDGIQGDCVSIDRQGRFGFVPRGGPPYQITGESVLDSVPQFLDVQIGDVDIVKLDLEGFDTVDFDGVIRDSGFSFALDAHAVRSDLKGQCYFFGSVTPLN